MAFPATTPKDTLNRRLDEIGWGLFFLITGVFLLAPARFPEGSWLTGVGLIMLGINAVRRLNGIRTSGFTIVLGVVALAAGIGDLLGVKIPWFAVLFILIGASLLVQQLLRREA